MEGGAELVRAAARLELARRRAARAETFEAAALRDFPALSFPQRAFCRLVDGLPPTDESAPCRTSHDPDAPRETLSMHQVYERLLGRPWDRDIEQRRQLVVLIAGRGSAKTMLAASRAKYRAAICSTAHLAAGERAHLPVVAPRMENAQQLLDFAAGFLGEQGNLGVEGRPGTKRIRFRRRTAISLYAADRGGLSVRSKSLADLFLDEAGFFYAASDYAVTDLDVAEAALFRLAADGQILATTSPYARAGLCYQVHRDQWGKSEAGAYQIGENVFRGVLVVNADSWFLNPAWVLKGQPGTASFEREARGRYVEDDDQGVATAEQVRACMAGRAGDEPPVRGASYRAHLDASGGGRSRTAFAVARPDGAGGVAVAAVRSWDRTTPIKRRLEEAAAVARHYGLREPAEADQWGFAAVESVAADAGLRVVQAQLDAVDEMSIAGELLRTGKVSLPPDDRLARQFPVIVLKLKQKGGLDLHVPFPPEGGHCDEAVAVAGAIAQASRVVPRRHPRHRPGGMVQADWTSHSIGHHHRDDFGGD